MKQFLTYILSALLLSSCIYPYEWNAESLPTDTVVIQGNIVVGGTSTLSVSSPHGIRSSFVDPVCTPYIEDDKGNRYPSTPESGIFRNVVPCNFKFDTSEAPDDALFRLVMELSDSFQYDKRTYSSKWLSTCTPPNISGIHFTSDDSNVYVSVSLDGGPESSGYVLLSFEETWRFHAEFLPQYVYMQKGFGWSILSVADDLGITDPESYFNYWCWASMPESPVIPVSMSDNGGSTLDHYLLHSFSRSDNRNHKRYSILVRAASVSADTYRYLKNLDETSEASGNLFTPNPGEIASNITCENKPGSMVLGYVNCYSPVSMRAYLDNSLYQPRIVYEGLAVPPTGNQRDYYEGGYRPIYEMSVPGAAGGGYTTGIAWGPERCINCVKAGGTLEKPDFWED